MYSCEPGENERQDLSESVTASNHRQKSIEIFAGFFLMQIPEMRVEFANCCLNAFESSRLPGKNLEK